MADLASVIRSHHATMFWERHDDPQLAKKYERILNEMVAAGIKDVGIELPPSRQRDLDAATKAYAERLKNGESLRSVLDSAAATLAVPETTNAVSVLTVMAAAHNLKIHAVDMADRDAGVFSASLDDYLVRRAMHGKISSDAFYASLGSKDFTRYSQIAGRPIDKAELKKIMSTDGGLDTLTARRYAGDHLTAQKIKETTEGRPFGMLSGGRHGGRTDTATDACGKEDLDGALRRIYGPQRVATVRINNNTTYKDEANYVMDDAGAIRTGKVEAKADARKLARAACPAAP